MLYGTTRSNGDVFTAQRVLTMNRAPDGGLFMPFRIPQFSQEEIQALEQRSFNGSVAEVLNLLFGTRLTSFDLDLALGRNPVRLHGLGQRITVAECWHNTDWTFDRLVTDLAQLVHPEQDSPVQIRGWTCTGIRIALLFGIFSQLLREKTADPDRKIDISLSSGDFSGPMAAWYGRYMGLPIGNIVCCCNENGNLWDFICHGQLRCDGVARTTAVQGSDILVPEWLEQLICLYGGPEETARYVDTLHCGGVYYVDEPLLRRMRQGIYVTVSSDKRICSSIRGAFATHAYLLTPDCALSYAGLMDYRARTGEMPPALLLEENSPAVERECLAGALGICEETLNQYLK